MGPNDGERRRPPPVGPPQDDAPLLITASIPKVPISVTDSFLKIDTQLTNITDSPLELVTMRDGADMYVVKDDVVLRGPGGKRPAGAIFTLAPGTSRTYKSTVNLGYPNDPSGEIQPLAPGSYQLYAVQRFIPWPPEGDPNLAFYVRGGPWDIQVG
ncbi:hypothetical protein [Kribbella caucasensis]|uniref:hypothetical protein n=1 Tax=Kribbella caucasensis TaxID=2512215 RepID=UPI00105F0322|nr:hypothetical protein [Kribbella sp. VKM Ac-2527]